MSHFDELLAVAIIVLLICDKISVGSALVFFFVLALVNIPMVPAILLGLLGFIVYCTARWLRRRRIDAEDKRLYAAWYAANREKFEKQRKQREEHERLIKMNQRILAMGGEYQDTLEEAEITLGEIERKHGRTPEEAAEKWFNDNVAALPNGTLLGNPRPRWARGQ